ncbi:FAD binding domain-containing protein [Bisporella sp. PMI_857]|nr:FAD binding domain-containing protein [Bisporella sp. PMI_857]
MKEGILKSSLKLRVVIAGAGLGGLAAGIGIAKAGHEVEIVEQSSSLKEVGAGIQVPPNSTSVLRALGVLSEVEKASVKPYGMSIYSYRDGSTLSTQPLHPYCRETYNAPYLLIHRADFHAILVSAALAAGVTIRLKSPVKSVDFARPALLLENGEEVLGDVILGADGLRSRCREALLGRKDPPVPCGSLAYRITLNEESLRGHEDLRSLVDYPEFHSWMGPDSHVVFYPLRTGQLCNLVLVAPDNLPKFEDSAAANLAEITDLMKNWEPRIHKLMGMVTSTTKWRLQDNVELDRWTSDQGTFTMLGDACHATVPYLAQGAAQAIEDAGTLTALFERLKAKEEIPSVLKKYENIRKARTTRVVKESAEYRLLSHLPDGPEQRVRDARMLNDEPFEGFPNRWADPVFQKWLWGHDAEEAVVLEMGNEIKV